MVIGTLILLGVPGGAVQQSWRCRRKASISLSDNWFEFAFGAPIPTLLLTTSPVAARRCGVRLSSSASTLRGSNLGCSFFGGVLGSALASTFFSGLGSAFFGSDFCSAFFGSGFARSFLIASAIRSRCGSDCCFFSGVGGVGSGGGVVLSIEACTSVLATLAAGSSGGLGAPSCSATGFAG